MSMKSSTAIRHEYKMDMIRNWVYLISDLTFVWVIAIGQQSSLKHENKSLIQSRLTPAFNNSDCFCWRWFHSFDIVLEYLLQKNQSIFLNVYEGY